MAVTTTKSYGASTKMPTMKQGGASTLLTTLSYSELSEYVKKKYLDSILDANYTFSIYENGYYYDFNDKGAKSVLLDHYESIADYTEKSLAEQTNYKMDGWEMMRTIIDPESEEVIESEELELIQSGNTYNSSYLGLVHLDWRVYHDEETDKYFAVIHRHLGGDVRGNYAETLILEGDDGEEVFLRFFSNFVSGGANIYLTFKDGSTASFESQQDSDVFYFETIDIEGNKNSLAKQLESDFEQFNGYKGDEFLEMIVDLFNASKPVKQLEQGGQTDDDSPKVYVRILGTGEGKWMNLTEYEDGDEFMTALYDWMKDLNREDGKNREEYEVSDYEGFGNALYYRQYMSESDFDEAIKGYQAYEGADYPSELVEEYMRDLSIKDVEDAISDMDEKSYGAYDSLEDWAYDMVNDDIYTPSVHDYYVSDTDKRLISNEDADSQVENMSFEDLLEYDSEGTYEAAKTKLEDEVSTLQDRLEILEENLEDSHGEDFEVISDAIVEVEEEISTKEEEIEGLEDEMKGEFEELAREDISSIIYDRLENDLEDYLSELGYENPAKASFVNVDYESVANDLRQDYNIYEADGKHYLFLSYEKGGKVKKLNRPTQHYTHFVMEMNSRKIVDGFESKEDAMERRKELAENNPKSRFSVYTKQTIESKHKLDSNTYKDWMDIRQLSNAQDVATKLAKGGALDMEIQDEAREIQYEIAYLRRQLKTAHAQERQDIKSDIAYLQGELRRTRAKHALKTGSMNIQSGVKRVGEGAKKLGRRMNRAFKEVEDDFKQKRAARKENGGYVDTFADEIEREYPSTYVEYGSDLDITVSSPDEATLEDIKARYFNNDPAAYIKYDSTQNQYFLYSDYVFTKHYKGGGELWIEDAVNRMKKKGTEGAFTKQAKRHGMKPVEFAKEVLANPDNYIEKTRRRAQFVKNTSPEKFEKGGDTWIQEAVEDMEKHGTVGAFTKQAKEHNMSTVEFANKVLSNPEDFNETTRERAQFMKNVDPKDFK